MSLRARVAAFAHMGVEADPGRMSAPDRAALTAGIALYKRHRDLIHAGDFLTFASAGAPYAWMSRSADRREALVLLARADQARHAETPPVTIPGLSPSRAYRVTIEEPWPRPASRGVADRAFWRERPVFTGEMLAQVGLRLPLIHPETAWVLHLEAQV